MKNWKTVSFFVCVFVFVREFRPIEPFYSAYMTSPAVNITLTQVTRDVYSVGSYSCFALIIVVFLMTDYLRYKPVLILDGICGIITYCSIVGHPSLFRMQIGQITYGFFYSSEVASFGYLYAMTDDKRHFQQITGQARAASQFGKLFSSALAQVVIIVNGFVPYAELVYLSIFGMLFSFVWACIMPNVNKSVYFHNSEPTDEPTTSTVTNYSSTLKSKTPIVAIESQPTKKKEDTETTEKVTEKTFGYVLRYLWKDFKLSYSNPYVRKFSLWWVIAFGGYLQVYTYINVLYTDIMTMDDNLNLTMFNGAAESMNTLLGGIAAYLIGRLEFNWLRVGDLFLTTGSILIGLVLFGCFYIRIIWFIYAFYIGYGCLYQTMLTVAE